MIERVSLTQAVSWLALGEYLDSDALWARIADNHECRQRAEEAIARLIASGEHSTLGFTGRKSASLDAYQAANVEEMQPVAFASYQRFDMGHDALLFGTPAAFDDEYWFDLYLPGPGDRNDGYFDVTLWKSELSPAFPNGGSNSQPTSKQRHEIAVAWCRAWILERRGNGMDSAWDEFKIDPRHAGSSRDNVFRPAWKNAKTT